MRRAKGRRPRFQILAARFVVVMSDKGFLELTNDEGTLRSVKRVCHMREARAEMNMLMSKSYNTRIRLHNHREGTIVEFARSIEDGTWHITYSDMPEFPSPKMTHPTGEFELLEDRPK